ncbi:DUF3135 domain-containing protein [Shewanella sp. Isolate11]|uniref:DUF3135 domain-containing protein n=1 Tax=Shewanella sp. Isolate11 TaxID=2908530 RepID=UPI001EFD8CAE|nr:DUF3135 domain-containing protein [Shewanella sp. Isolate11]MCG9696354.1 DUF3135 domain-containing protein [Shewanella sp. Isolate11]
MVELPNFDTLKWLAKHDPDKLAALQDELSQATIEQASEHHRPQLRARLYNFNLKMSRCNNPLERCILAAKMVNDKVVFLNQVVTNPDAYIEQRASILPYSVQKKDQAL